MQVVELGCAVDLRLAIEGTTLAEIEVSEVAEFVERNDVGDFSPMFG